VTSLRARIVALVACAGVAAACSGASSVAAPPPTSAPVISVPPTTTGSLPPTSFPSRLPNDLCPEPGCTVGAFTHWTISDSWVDAIDLPDAWTLSHGDGVTVVVLDSAIAHDPDLNSKVDDRVVGRGVTPTANPTSGFHGTAMASIIGAEPNNGEGVAGVGWDVRLASVDMGERYNHFRDLETERSWDRAHLVPLFKQAAAIPGARIISFSSEVNPSPAFAREIRKVVAAGIVVVAAAGNETGVGVTTRRYPAAYDGVIGVGAAIVAPDGSVGVWEGSNVGPQVDVYAPTYVPAILVPGKIDLGSGTSSATAVTSGVVALLLARDPGLTPTDVERLLEQTASPFPARAFHIDQTNGAVVEGGPIPGHPTTRLIDAGTLLKAAGASG